MVIIHFTIIVDSITAIDFVILFHFNTIIASTATNFLTIHLTINIYYLTTTDFVLRFHLASIITSTLTTLLVLTIFITITINLGILFHFAPKIVFIIIIIILIIEFILFNVTPSINPISTIDFSISFCFITTFDFNTKLFFITSILSILIYFTLTYCLC